MRTLIRALVAGLVALAASVVVLNSESVPPVRVTATAASLVDAGLAGPAPDPGELASYEVVPAPAVRFQASAAQATTVPWVDSNGWRFQRGLRKAYYQELPAGSAALAAAEASAFGVAAVLNPKAEDVEALGAMLRFLQQHARPPLPVMANIGVVDNASPMMGEVLNLLTRRNLLYRVVDKPDPSLDLTVRIGSADFPAEAAANPHEFAQMVRAKLGDDKRLVRLYGTTTVIAHLTGDGTRARLHLLSYGRSRRGGTTLQAMRVRVLGKYTPTLAGFGTTEGATLTDIDHPGDATEFWVPSFTAYAIVDLERVL